MRRTLRSALTATTVLAGIAAGASAQELVTADRAGNPDAPNVLTVRTNDDFSPNSPFPDQRAGFVELFQKFAEEHPDWQIQFEYMSDDIGGEHARLLEQARAGRAPDCVAVNSFQLALFIEAGVLQPLDQYFSKEEIDDLFPFIRAGVVGKDGHLYAWWWNTDLRVLYYNKDYVTEPPVTWEELQTAAVEASEKGVDGVLFNGGRWEGTTFDWLANFWAQGGRLVDDSGKPIFGEGEDRAKMLNAMNYFKGLVESGAAPARVSTIKTYDDFNAAASAGTVAMFFGGHWQYYQLQGMLPPDAFSKWEIAELPGPTPDERATGTGGWTMAAFSNDPAKIEICADLTRDVFMGPGNEVMGQLPTRETLFDSLPAFQDPFFAKLKEYLVHGQARPGVPIYPEISNQIQIMMGEVLSGSKEPEAALDDAWQGVMDAYNKS